MEAPLGLCQSILCSSARASCFFLNFRLPVQLCKSIVLENTQLPVDAPDFGDPHASRYVCVVVQYATRLNTDKLRRHLHRAHKTAGGRLPVKCYNLRLCPEEVRNSRNARQVLLDVFLTAYVCWATHAMPSNIA